MTCWPKSSMTMTLRLCMHANDVWSKLEFCVDVRQCVVASCCVMNQARLTVHHDGHHQRSRSNTGASWSLQGSMRESAQVMVSRQLRGEDTSIRRDTNVCERANCQPSPAWLLAALHSVATITSSTSHHDTLTLMTPKETLQWMRDKLKVNRNTGCFLKKV